MESEFALQERFDIIYAIAGKGQGVDGVGDMEHARLGG
jgi:hypothetical protein